MRNARHREIGRGRAVFALNREAMFQLMELSEVLEHHLLIFVRNFVLLFAADRLARRFIPTVVVVASHTDDDQTLVGIGFLPFAQMRECGDARAAPDGPEVEQHDFALEFIGSQRRTVRPRLDLQFRGGLANQCEKFLSILDRVCQHRQRPFERRQSSLVWLPFLEFLDAGLDQLQFLIGFVRIRPGDRAMFLRDFATVLHQQRRIARLVIQQLLEVRQRQASQFEVAFVSGDQRFGSGQVGFSGRRFRSQCAEKFFRCRQLLFGKVR